MIGQGRPPSAAQMRRRLIVIMICSGVILGMLMAVPRARAHALVVTPPDRTHVVKLRLTWGGGANRTWRVRVRSNDAIVSEPRLLSIAADAPGSAYMHDGELVVVQPSPSNYGGIDFVAAGYSNSRLTVEIDSAEAPQQKTIRTIQLGDLKSTPLHEYLDSERNRFVLARAPGDQIQVDVQRPHLIFDPGERWVLQTKGNLTGYNNSHGLKLHARITRAREGTNVLMSQVRDVDFDQWGNAQPIAWDFPVPDVEGVYDLTFSFESAWYQAKVNADKVIRKVQFVVLDRRPPTDGFGANPVVTQWNEIPQERYDSQRQSKSDTGTFWNWGTPGLKIPMRAARDSETAESSDTAGNLAVPREGALSLGPGESQVLPLHVGDIDRPHRLTIEYSSAATFAVGISILQPKDDEPLSNFGFHSGIASNDSQSWLWDAESQKSAEHSFVFWPNTDRPFLLVSNRHPTSDLSVMQVKVEQGPQRLARPSESILPVSAQRQRLAFLEMPLIAENFGGSKHFDVGSGEHLDDWLTFYTSADRMVQYLKSTQHTGLMLAANANGGGLYPSSLMQFTPQFDSGAFYSTGQDPIPKDVLELLFRMFAREGLSLVTTLSLSDPLPSLESQVHHLPSGLESDIELRDYRGQRMQKSQPMPLYNPLSLQVRGAVEDVVEELAERYGRHSSFQGISLLCRGDTLAMLPGRKWGYDLVTIQRFYRDSLPEEPEPTSENLASAIASLLRGERRQQWIDWRCRQIAQNYGTWERRMQSIKPASKFYLASVDLFRVGDMNQSLSPSLHVAANLSDALRDVGWDSAIWSEETSAVFLRPRRVAPNESLAQQRIEMHVDQSRQMDQYFGQLRETGDLFCRRDRWVGFAELGQGIPELDSYRDHQSLELVGPVGEQNRRRFAEALYRYDSRLIVDGGWLLNMQPEDSTSRWFAAFAALPDLPFLDVSSHEGRSPVRPCAVRQVVTPTGQSYAYVVNSSPWSCRVKLQFRRPTLGVEVTPPQRDSTMVVREPSDPLIVELEPYGLVALSHGDVNNAIVGYEVELPPEAGTRLRQYFHSLQAKLSLASKPAEIQVLQNPNCQGLEGWTYGASTEPSLVSQVDEATEDRQVFRLVNSGEVAWMRSNWFPNPATGRLTLSVWLRTEAEGQQPPLRIAVESNEEGVEYYRFGSVGQLANNSPGNQLEGTWKQFIVHFDDLPINPQAKLRIGLDLMDTGSVWVDRFELYDRWFDENDLKAITQFMASAGPLLANPATVDEARILLQGYWPQFIDQMFGSQLNLTNVAPNQHPSASSRLDSMKNAPNAEGGEVDGVMSREGFMSRRLRRSTKQDLPRQR